MTARQEAVMATLIGCRSDLVNYTSALRGMNPRSAGRRSTVTRSCFGWLKELGKTGRPDNKRTEQSPADNRVPDGTRNGENEEDACI